MLARPSAAVVGAGFVGAQHVDALRRIGTDVRVLAASTPEHARAAAAALGVPASTGDWRSAVGDPAIDVVHVCVPNDLHRDVTLAALTAGKHVVCEKPLGLTLREGIELRDAVARTDRVAVLCHNYRFYPLVAELRLRVADGELGALHAIRGHYLQDWLLQSGATNWRIDPGRGGPSRVLADIGTHWVDLAETVSGMRLSEVLAQLATVHARRPDFRSAHTFSDSVADGALVAVATEDQAQLLLRFDGGVHGSLVVSQVAAGHRNDLLLALDGAHGSVTWRQEEPDHAWLGGDAEVVRLDRSPMALRPGARSLARLPAGHNEGWDDGLRNLLAAAYARIAGTRDEVDEAAAPMPTFDDGVRHLAFVEAAMQSAREERWTTVADVLAAQAAQEVT